MCKFRRYDAVHYMREVRSIKKLQENKDLQRIAAEYFGRKE